MVFTIFHVVLWLKVIGENDRGRRMNSYLLWTKKLVLIFFAALAVMGFGASSALAAMGDRLEIAVSKASVYAGPSSTASRLFSLNSGEQMVEMERQGSWVFVSVKRTSAQGWVRSSQVQQARAKTVTRKVSKSVAKVKSASKVKKQQKEEADITTTSRRVSLEGLGFKNGVMFEGTAGTHAHTFFFDSPLDTRIVNGKFRLLYRASPDIHKKSSLRISVNGVPYKQVGLSADGAMHELDVMLPASAFHGEHVKVTVRNTLLVTEDRCFDDRINGAYLHLLPESSLTIAYQSVERSIRDAWRMLPQKVSISLSEGRLSEDQFASALGLMALLVEDGKEVVIKRLPEIGDVVIAPKVELEKLIDDKRITLGKTGQVASMGRALDHVSNLALISLQNRSAIVVTDPYDVQPMYLLSNEWRLLAAGKAYRVYRPDDLRMKLGLLGQEGDAGYYSLPLAKLGLEPGVKYLTRETSWQMVIQPFTLPVGTRPDFLSLNVIAPVRWEKDPTYEMYVFLNDVLVKSARLENTGLVQSFTVNLPPEYQKQYNDIRVVVQHDIDQGDCRGVMPHDYVQITPDSALVVKKIEDAAPTKFSDLGNYFSQGFDTYLERSYLSSPERALHLLARLSADFPLLIDHSRLTFAEADDVLQPSNPFLAVGHFTLGDHIEAPVRFDRGRVQILSPNGDTYFDVSNLSGITVAEIVKASSSYGLWVSPSDAASLPMMERLELTEDDVAFIDSLGVIKTLNSQEPSLAQVYYPDVEDWFDVLGKYRFWLMVLLWFLLTMVIVYLYRMSRTNKLAREEDDALYQEEEERMQGDAAAHMHEDHTVHPGDALGHLDEKR